MKIKLPFLAAILFLVPAIAYAIGTYKTGDKLISHAQNGLVLRKTADPKGERIASIVYGDEVTVLKNDQPKKAHQVEEFPGYKIKGYWVKVKTKRGVQRLEWQKIRERNEALDCRVYARAAAWIAGADRWTEAMWRDLEQQVGPPTEIEEEQPVDTEPTADSIAGLVRRSPKRRDRRVFRSSYMS